jgi:RNA polymerase sigma-70 factor (ECF subfamily)
VQLHALHLQRRARLLVLEAEVTLRTAMDARALVEELMGERARFVRLARSRVATEADAEDVVQRAMMRAAERAPQLADAGRARAWFYRILRRAIVDHHRRAPRETTGEGPQHEPAAEDEGPRAPVCQCALRMLAELRPAYAEVVRRIDLEGEDPAAVASAARVSMTNLYVRLHRARRALRQRVQGHCGVSSMTPCLECTCHAQGRCVE